MPDEEQTTDPTNKENKTISIPVSTPGSVTDPGASVDSSENTSQPDIINAAPQQPESQAAPPTVDNNQTENPAEKPSLAITSSGPVKTQGKAKKLLLKLLVLVLLGAGAFGAWTYMQNRGDNQKAATKQSIQEIETLRVGSTEGPANSFFPNEQLLGVYFSVNRQIYEGLVGLTDKKVTPLLAKSWTNPDEKTWVFTLKDNITFHTGKKVTANEVKASLDSLKDYEYWSLFVSTIDSVEVLNDTQIKIITTEPDALLLNRLSLAFIIDLTAPEAEGKNGTGAYMVDSSATNDEYTITLNAYDNYHGEKPLTKKVVYRIYEGDDAVMSALRKGEVDIADTLHIPENRQKLTQEGYASVEFDSPGAFGMYLNQTRSNTTILKKKEIREALALAVDRTALVEELAQQHMPSYQVIPKSLPGHDASIRMPDFSLEKAKDALQEAGYKNEPLDFFYIEGVQADAPIIIKQLKAAGFNIRERVYQESTIPNMVAEINAGRFDLFTASFSSDFVDARDLLGALLHSTESSYPVLEDPVYDNILLESDKAFDPVERTKKLQEANRYIADNYLWIPIRNTVYMAYYKPELNVPHDYFGGGNLGVYFRKVSRTVN